jgi:hypothetical protein
LFDESLRYNHERGAAAPLGVLDPRGDLGCGYGLFGDEDGVGAGGAPEGVVVVVLSESLSPVRCGAGGA